MKECPTCHGTQRITVAGNTCYCPVCYDLYGKKVELDMESKGKRYQKIRALVVAIWSRLGPLRLFLALLFKPRAIRLTQEQAEYVESLYLSNPDPAAIGRAFNQLYGAEIFRYFMVPNAEGTALVFEPRDQWLDGLEYIRAAMVRLGAIIVRRQGGKKWDCYQPTHRMVQRTAEIAAGQPMPESRTKGA